jgi:tRNA nucleotidyltransferase (CCA-adding enzyme)
MSDYLFMLENHLSTEQNRVVEEVQTAASQANLSLFLAGGAMRDMLGGFQIRDLDFMVEGDPLKIAKALAARTGAKVIAIDDKRRTVELEFGAGVTAEIAMARTERYPKPGAAPQVNPATIQEDLRRRDFTVNAIALSLNRASRGLLLDPLNGLADLGRRELRASYATALYDDPSRLLRLIRFKLRLGYAVEERTQSQYANAREAEMESYIPRRALGEELRRIASEPNAAEIVRALEEEGLLKLFSPALAGPKLNIAGLAKLEKMRRMLPREAASPGANWAPFLFVLTEKLGSKDKQSLIKQTEMRTPEVNVWQKLPARGKKLESALKSVRLKKPSHVYEALSKAQWDEVQYLLYCSQARLVQDRIRNYLQKYLPMAQEVADSEVDAKGAAPGTPKFQKAKEELIAARLDGRAKKPAPLLEPPVPITASPRGRVAR